MLATVIWDDEPGGNVEHLAEHEVTPEEADEVILNDNSTSITVAVPASRASSDTLQPVSTFTSFGTL
jgi:hypothetical protein